MRRTRLPRCPYLGQRSSGFFWTQTFLSESQRVESRLSSRWPIPKFSTPFAPSSPPALCPDGFTHRLRALPHTPHNGVTIGSETGVTVQSELTPRGVSTARGSVSRRCRL